jgi:hypothetical protein
MKQITSRLFDEKVIGIDDEFSRQERDANDIGRQIFEKYNYKPVKLLNLDNRTFSPSSNFNSPEYGIDALLYCEDIPDEDLLNLNQVKPLNYDNRFFAPHYNVDYKSNNFSGDSNSVYVKLMRYGSTRKYTEDKISGYLKSDKQAYLNALEKNEELPESFMAKFFENRYLLGDNNFTDYLIYMKYTKPDYALKKAYLIPAEILRNQVISILNEMLEIEPENSPIILRKDIFNLNLQIRKAYLTYKHNRHLFNDIEMFVTRSKSLILRLPEHLLTDYIKFDVFGNISARATTL